MQVPTKSELPSMSKAFPFTSNVGDNAMDMESFSHRETWVCREAQNAFQQSQEEQEGDMGTILSMLFPLWTDDDNVVEIPQQLVQSRWKILDNDHSPRKVSPSKRHNIVIIPKEQASKLTPPRKQSSPLSRWANGEKYSETYPQDSMIKPRKHYPQQRCINRRHKAATTIPNSTANQSTDHDSRAPIMATIPSTIVVITSERASERRQSFDLVPTQPKRQKSNSKLLTED